MKENWVPIEKKAQCGKAWRGLKGKGFKGKGKVSNWSL